MLNIHLLILLACHNREKPNGTDSGSRDTDESECTLTEEDYPVEVFLTDITLLKCEYTTNCLFECNDNQALNNVDYWLNECTVEVYDPCSAAGCLLDLDPANCDEFWENYKICTGKDVIFISCPDVYEE
jgi:hypothetical protein